jgi:DNA modification methylase
VRAGSGNTIERFARGGLQDVPLDTTTIRRDRLNIEDRVRTNLFPYSGQFSPQLVQAFLSTYASKGDHVLDPFMGSGTVLVEAGRLGLGVGGAEINPAAFQMARTYTLINAEAHERSAALTATDKVLERVFLGGDTESTDSVSIKARLVELSRHQKEALPRVLLEGLVVLLDFLKPGLTRTKVASTWRRMRERVEGLPYSTEPVEPMNCDARQVPVQSGAVDLVITSPPYINVFNYHQQYRASVESLGWDLLRVARSEMGSNRKNRGNRFLTVIQYCLDMVQALLEMRRLCKPSGRIVTVVGRESNVRKTAFYNGDIVTHLGIRCAGLEAEKRQERVFKNKFGALICEDIIHFRPSQNQRVADALAPVVAHEALSSALTYAPSESLPDLEDAITRLAQITPSPLYSAARSVENGRE